jgi:hypothetical protein
LVVSKHSDELLYASSLCLRLLGILNAVQDGIPVDAYQGIKQDFLIFCVWKNYVNTDPPATSRMIPETQAALSDTR